MAYFQKKGWVVELNDCSQAYATKGKVFYEGKLVDTFKPSGMDHYDVYSLKVGDVKKPCFVRGIDRNGMVDLFIYSPSRYLLAEIEKLNVNYTVSIQDDEGRIFEVELDELFVDDEGKIYLNKKEIPLLEGKIISLREELKVSKQICLSESTQTL